MHANHPMLPGCPATPTGPGRNDHPRSLVSGAANDRHNTPVTPQSLETSNPKRRWPRGVQDPIPASRAVRLGPARRPTRPSRPGQSLHTANAGLSTEPGPPIGGGTQPHPILSIAAKRPAKQRVWGRDWIWAPNLTHPLLSQPAIRPSLKKSLSTATVTERTLSDLHNEDTR